MPGPVLDIALPYRLPAGTDPLNRDVITLDRRRDMEIYDITLGKTLAIGLAFDEKFRGMRYRNGSGEY